MQGTVAALGIGFVFGLALAVPPGPINAIIAEESVYHGVRQGVVTGLGAMSADVCLLVVVALGLGPLVLDKPLVQSMMLGVGGVLMLVFGYQALKEAIQRTTWGEESTPRSQGYTKTFVLSITNPYQLVFWLTVGLALLQPDRIDIGAYLPLVSEVVIETGRPILFVGLFGGVLAWILVFPLGLHFLGRRIDRFAPAVAVVSAVILLAFGSLFLLEAITGLL